MELRQLEYFVAVVDQGGFTRAAEHVHVAQPGVSAQVRRLERELGHDLLDRSGRQVRLTDVGAAVLPFARAALAAIDGARATVGELTGLLRGRIAVGTVTSHRVDLPALLSEFHEQHPGVEITLVEDDSAGLAANLRAGTLDAAILSLGPEPLAGLDHVVVTDETITAAVGTGHVLADRTELAVTELRDRALICLPRGTGIRAHLEAACAAAGFTPHVAFEAGDPSMLARLALSGLGVAVLPDSVARNQHGLHPLTLVRPRLRGQLVFAWRADGPVSPAARVFLSHARTFLDH